MTESEIKYKDIINLKHHVSVWHPRMSIYKRSAQFAPFAALTGFNDEVIEASRITINKKILTNEEKMIISEKLKFIYDNLLRKEVSFVYFVSDRMKKGGKYMVKTGIVRRIDLYNRFVIFMDKFKINIDDIIDIK